MNPVSRRHALRLLGFAAAVAASDPRRAMAQTPEFPKGAVIRGLLKDYAPAELAGGATLFHEHLSLGTDFSDRFRAASLAVLQAQGLPAPQRPPGPPRRPRALIRCAT